MPSLSPYIFVSRFASRTVRIEWRVSPDQIEIRICSNIIEDQVGSFEERAEFVRARNDVDAGGESDEVIRTKVYLARVRGP
ncbi:hypothetical protein SAMN05216278_3588 [Halopelagius longus]|uniref:Uncharacterized protein n=1 Tax=Halopelagius longus TaxID=1236180 RepID=A0A1H1G8F8_9EURY|nr:hypothetical protein SAMN05216278_3588 [Halopelagius longus]